MYQQRTELTSFTLDTFDEEATACLTDFETMSEPTELDGLPVSLSNDVIVRQSETAVKNQRLIKPFQPLRSGRVGIGHPLRTELTPERAWNESLHAAGVLINFTEPGDETLNIRVTLPFELRDWYLDSRVREASGRWTPDVSLMAAIGRATLTANGHDDISQLLHPHMQAFHNLCPERNHRVALRQKIFMTATVSQTVRQAGIIEFDSSSFQDDYQPTLQHYDKLRRLGIEPFRYDEIIDCFKPAVHECLSESEL